MAILNAPTAADSAAPPHAQPPDKPPLFARTIIPKGAISRTISCSLLPPHALSRASSSTSTAATAVAGVPSVGSGAGACGTSGAPGAGGSGATAAGAGASSPPSLKSCRQVVVSTDTSLQVLAVDDDTLSLRPLTDVMLFTSIYDIAAVSTPVMGRDVLVVLSASAKISFLQFDDSASRLRCSGQVSLIPPNSPPIEASMRAHPRLLATHPRKRMVAFAPLQSRISVFPVLFLSKRVNAGKIASVSVDGVVLSLDFLEDDEGVPGDAILLALVQRGKHQVISLYTVGVPPDSSGGLSVKCSGSMITCASHPNDVAVARATSKLTGQSVQPTPPAVAVTRLPGCPFLFAVFVHGKIIAGDARSVIVNAHAGDAHIGDGRSISVHIEDDVMLPTRSTPLDDFSPVPVPVPVLDEPHMRPDSPDRTADLADAPDTPIGQHAASSHADDAGASSAAAAAAAAASVGESADGFVTPIHTPVIRNEPPSAPQQRRQLRYGRDDIPQVASLSRRPPGLGGGFSSERNVGEDYLSYLYVPAYITLDVGDANGVATAWVDARDHFRDESGDGNGLYFVMESGAMYALKWSDSVKDGSTTFRIPGGERTRTSPKRNFCVEYIGDVGPASSIASLDRKLIFIANDGADGSLRRLHLPHTIPAEKNLDSRTSTFKRRLSGRWDGGRYGLEVRQEFLNLAPISDFVIVPPRKTEAPQLTGAGYTGDVSDEIAGSSSTGMSSQHGSDTHQTAREHVLRGSSSEAEMVVCSGMGRYGCVRIVRPGAPVSIFASTGPSFQGCNDMWSLRFSVDSPVDSGITLSFAQATRLLLAAPPTAETYDDVDDDDDDRPPVIASMVDGTRASGLLSDCRSIQVKQVEDGIIAQIHERGVRLVLLQEAGDTHLSNYIINGELHKSIVEETVDWEPENGGIVSTGTIGAGFVLISVVRPGGSECVLNLLKCYRGNPKLGLCVVSSTELDVEVSSLEIPEWTTVYSDSRLNSPRFPPMAVIGTYRPSVEIRLLGPTMDVVASRVMYPWSFITSPEVAVRGRAAYDYLADTTKAKSFSKDDSAVPRYTPSAKSDLMTAVPENLCSVEIEDRRKIFAGLRDGSVVCLSLNEAAEPVDAVEGTSLGGSAELIISSHRKLGHRPVTLKSVVCAVGRVVIGQAERPWMGACTGGGRMKWTPLAFTETQAVCAFSVPGAERCFATVAHDNSFYICGLRRQTEVSVRSIHVGATPRRVLAVQEPEDGIVVATSCDPINQVAAEDDDPDDQLLFESEEFTELSKQSELRLYDKTERQLVTNTPLLRGELTHVLLRWMQYIVVGTSLGLRSYESAEAQKTGKRGRLLLYMFRDAASEAGSSSNVSPAISFELCCEIVLPGAILAGDVNVEDELLAISCNQDVLVFAIAKPRNVLVEIARVSSATMVVSLSFKEDMVCVVDQKASLSLFHLKKRRCRLIRDRSDHRRRILSDAVLVDRTLAIGVDRFGAMLTIGYADGDDPPEQEVMMAEASAVYPLLLSMRAHSDPDGLDAGIAASHIHGSALSGSINLGEEYDVIQQESESENTLDDSNAAAEGSGGGLDNDAQIGEAGEAGPDVEEDPMAIENANAAAGGDDGFNNELNVNDLIADDSDNISNEENIANNVENENANVDEDMNEGGLVPAVEEAAENEQDDAGAGGEPEVAADGDEMEEMEGIETERRNQCLQRIPRNLKCHHAYNMQDTALRVRLGTFSRAGRVVEMDSWGAGEAQDLVGGECFFSKWSSAAFCGTLGGSVVSMVGMSHRAFAMLSAVETAMSVHPEIAGPGLGSSHKRFRAAYGPSATGVVDGDLLTQFEGLRDWVKRRIARRLGLDGEHGVLHIEAMIRDLCDRVG